MKKILLFVFVWLFMFPSVFAKHQVNLTRRVQDRIEKQNSSLYNVIRRELQNYYKRDDFSDPNHQSGWYRVDDFLTWVKKNESQLENEKFSAVEQKISLKQIYANSKAWSYEPLYRSFWVYLGGRYIADVYQVKADFSRLSIVFCDNTACTIGGTGTIFISPQSKEVIPSIINMGMHETTHMLPYLMGNKKDQLSELATFYTQYNYGLPVRAKDALTLADGVRDMRRSYQLRPDFNLLYEYNSFIAGHVLNKKIRPVDVLSFVKEGSEISILEVCLNLVALGQKRLFIQNLDMKTGTTLSLPEDMLTSYMENMNFTQADVEEWKARPTLEFYLGKFKYNKTPFLTSRYGDKIHVFVKYDRDVFVFSGGYVPATKQRYLEDLVGKNASLMASFYDSLVSWLPPGFVQETQEEFSVQTNTTFLISGPARKERNKLGKRYEAALKRAVMQALKESGAPPAPAIPEGYI